MQKIYCKYCGEKIDYDSKFCAKCGKLLINNSELQNISQQLHERIENRDREVKIQYDEDYTASPFISRLGILILLVTILLYVIVRNEGVDYDSSKQFIIGTTLFFLITRILSIYIVYQVAKEQNRQILAWLALALFFPAIALIVVGNSRKILLAQS